MAGKEVSGMVRLILALISLGAASPSTAQTFASSQGQLRVTEMASGFEVPWAIAFLPGGGFLVTERAGSLYYVYGKQKHRVKGSPRVFARGQGGLLDVMVPRDFARSRQIFLTYSKKQGRGSGTALAVGTLSEDFSRLNDLRMLFEATSSSTSTRHYGSRVIEAPDGTLYMTLGERGERDSAQDLLRQQGSVVHLNRDGSSSPDNPFIQHKNAYPQIWSYGHRNPQGLALGQRGELWAVEHGAMGGDEINLIEKGANYGWPVISYGRHYSGRKIGEGTSKSGMRQPSWYWDPSIAPSGMIIYSGKLWPNWSGHIFVGSLKFGYISRLSGHSLSERERLKGAETGRIRDVVEAPDGSIWFASQTQGAIYRLSPTR